MTFEDIRKEMRDKSKKGRRNKCKLHQQLMNY